jgi:hypothetical protein
MLAKCENRIRVLPSSPQAMGKVTVPPILPGALSRALPFLNAGHDNAREA